MQLHLWREGMTSAHFTYVNIECWATVRHAQCTLGAVVQCWCKHTDYSLEHLRLKSRKCSKILIQPCVCHKCTIRTCSTMIGGMWRRQQTFQRGPTEIRAPVDVATVRSSIHRRRFWCNEIGFNQTTFKWIQMMWLNWGSEGNKASTGDEARVRVRVCVRLSQRIVRLISQQPPAETLLHFNIKQLWRKAF